MSFTDWYKKMYDEEWQEEFSGLYGYALQLVAEYEAYCKENQVEPKWNG